jgi:hypothetical protein
VKPGHEQWDEHTLDLMVEEVTCGLAPNELESLLSRVDRGEFAALERAAAALSVAGLGRLEEPPASLMARLKSEARARYPGAPKSISTPAPRANWSAWSGWLAAAALLVAFLSRGVFQHARTIAESREEFVASAKDLVRASWQATKDPLAGSVNGDVVWSSTRQEGYMRFRDLPPNDPKKSQYQLWIFDAKRAQWEAKPVDGGVFDIGPGGEAVVPIHAKLDVRDAKLFGVTLETPGGVVVSDREHLLATASP